MLVKVPPATTQTLRFDQSSDSARDFGCEDVSSCGAARTVQLMSRHGRETLAYSAAATAAKVSWS